MSAKNRLTCYYGREIKEAPDQSRCAVARILGWRFSTSAVPCCQGGEGRRSRSKEVSYGRVESADATSEFLLNAVGQKDERLQTFVASRGFPNSSKGKERATIPLDRLP
jgi:hypothetical protein